MRGVHLDGGAATTLAEFASGFTSSEERVSDRGLVGGGYYFVSSFDAGVFAYDIKNKRTREFSQRTGFPLSAARSVAYLNGTLYVAMDSDKGSYFFAVNPESGDYKILSASGSREDGSPFNDIAARMRVTAMRACPETGKILMGVTTMTNTFSHDSDKDNKNGAYEYDVITGKFRRLLHLQATHIFRPVPFNGEYIFGGNGWAGRYDARSAKAKVIYDCCARSFHNGELKRLTPGITAKIPMDMSYACPIAAIKDYLWTQSLGRIAIATGDAEYFPSAFAPTIMPGSVQIAPADKNGDRVLVCGDTIGLVCLDMSGR